MYFLISAALLVNVAFAANVKTVQYSSTGNLGLSGIGLSGASGLSGLSGISGLSGLSGAQIISSSAAPAVSEVVVGGGASQGLALGGAGALSGAGEVIIGGAPALSGASLVGEQIISGGALTGGALTGGALTTGTYSTGAYSTGFTPLGVTTYTAQAPAVKNIYRDSSHVHPAKEIVYKIKTPPKVHQKVVKIQQVVKQPKINVLEVVQSPKIQKLSILEKPAGRIVDVAPTKHTSSQIVVKAPEAPLTQKVFYSEKARESSGHIVSYEKHNIKPAQVSTISAGAPGGVYVSHSGPTYTGGQTFTSGATVGGQTFETVNVGAVQPALTAGAIAPALTTGSVTVEGQTLPAGAVSGQTLDLGAVSGQTVNLGALSGQTLNVGGQTFETTSFGADPASWSPYPVEGSQGIELGAGALSAGVVAGADAETALNLGSAVGGGNVKTWVENNANGLTHHKVVKGGDLATWNAEFGSTTFGAGHDLNPAWKK